MSASAILIDCRWLRERSGAGRVTQHVLRGFADVEPPARPVVLWGDPDAIARVLGDVAWCSIEPSRFDGSALYGQRQLLSIPPHDGALYLHQNRPLRAGRNVTMIYDTIQAHHAATATRRRARRIYLRRVVRTSKRILTISEHSRRMIIGDLDCPPERVHVVRLPMDAALADRVRQRRSAGPAPTDILYVGRVDAHKNLDGLLDAFAASGLDGRHRLRLFGPTGTDRTALLDRARGLGITRFDVATATDDDDLVEAYARAAVVVLPSFIEGWGLPTFEAIACGIPVVASNGGAIVEQLPHAHSSVQLVDVRAPGALAAALADAPLDVPVADMDRSSLAALADGPTVEEFAATMLARVAEVATSLR